MAFLGIATGLFCVRFLCMQNDRYTNVNQESKNQTKIYSSKESNKRKNNEEEREKIMPIKK